MPSDVKPILVVLAILLTGHLRAQTLDDIARSAS